LVVVAEIYGLASRHVFHVGQTLLSVACGVHSECSDVDLFCVQGKIRRATDLMGSTTMAKKGSVLIWN
jgi:hypothetical protein